VDISYRPQGGDWTTVGATYSAYWGYWYYDWVIPGDATLGLYDVKVDADDPHGGADSLTELGEFAVTGNTPPTVEWMWAWGVPGGRLDPGGEIDRGGLVRLYSGVSDVETASSDLSVDISYRPQGGDWTTVGATYSAYWGYWYYDWVIPGDATLGLYDVKVDAEDPDGGFSSMTELGEFEVI